MVMKNHSDFDVPALFSTNPRFLLSEEAVNLEWFLRMISHLYFHDDGTFRDTPLDFNKDFLDKYVGPLYFYNKKSQDEVDDYITTYYPIAKKLVARNLNDIKKSAEFFKRYPSYPHELVPKDNNSVYRYFYRFLDLFKDAYHGVKEYLHPIVDAQELAVLKEFIGENRYEIPVFLDIQAKLMAMHESGHAVIALALFADIIQSLSIKIMPGKGGEFDYSGNKHDPAGLMAHIMVSMGGRIGAMRGELEEFADKYPQKDTIVRFVRYIQLYNDRYSMALLNRPSDIGLVAQYFFRYLLPQPILITSEKNDDEYRPQIYFRDLSPLQKLHYLELFENRIAYDLAIIYRSAKEIMDANSHVFDLLLNELYSEEMEDTSIVLEEDDDLNAYIKALRPVRDNAYLITSATSDEEGRKFQVVRLEALQNQLLVNNGNRLLDEAVSSPERIVEEYQRILASSDPYFDEYIENIIHYLKILCYTDQ
jgi:hypothetical protein